MKNLLSRIPVSIAVAVTFVPAPAGAHPGHSAFDFSAGLPHPGHEHEVAALLAAAALATLLFGVRWLFNRRR
jgi:hypothetical protein